MSRINIVITPGVVGGQPHIEGRRISVMQIAEYHAELNWKSEEIAEALALTLDEVHAALSYYYAHKDEIDTAIREAAATLEGTPTVQDVIAGRYKLVMTTSEVAEAYGIGNRTVREAIEKGWLKAQKSGGTWLIRRQDAEARWGHSGQQEAGHTSSRLTETSSTQRR
jgi:excisionase family DNA binding protein